MFHLVPNPKNKQAMSENQLKDTSFEEKLDGVLKAMGRLLKEKNKKYGNSVLEPLDIFNNKCNSGKVIDQKLSRIKNNGELVKNDVVDLMGYLILTCIEKEWLDFEDLLN